MSRNGLSWCRSYIFHWSAESASSAVPLTKARKMWLDTREGRSLLAQILWRPPISSIGLLENLDILDWRGHFDWFFEQTHTHTLWAPELDQLCVDMFSSTFPRVWVLFQGQVCGIWLLALSFQRTSLRNRLEKIHSNTDTIYGCVRSSENLNPMWAWHYVSTKARRGPDTFVPHNWIRLFLKKLQLKNKRFHWWNKPILKPETTMITFQTQGTLSRVKLRMGILGEPDRRQWHRHYGCEEAIPDPGGHS